MDHTDLLIARSNTLVEAQDAAASTYATPFPPIIAAPKSSAQRQREYRRRIAASRTPAQSIATRISDTERKRNYRQRKAANLALHRGSLESTTASTCRSARRSNDIQNGTRRQLTNQQRQSLAAEPAQTTVQSGTSSDQIEVPDKPMDLTHTGNLEHIFNYLKMKSDCDGVDHLFLSYADTFRRFPPREQAILKLELAKLFSKTELKLLQKEHSKSPYTSVTQYANDWIDSHDIKEEEYENLKIETEPSEDDDDRR